MRAAILVGSVTDAAGTHAAWLRGMMAKATLCFPALLLLGGLSACGGTSTVDVASADTADELSSNACRTGPNVDAVDCRLVGTVVRTFRDRDTCVLYLKHRDSSRTYGLVESASGPASTRCSYTRAFANRGAIPFIWTRYADTKTLPRAEQEAIRRKDHVAQATTYYSLTGDLHGDIPGPTPEALEAINAAIGFSSGGDPALTNAITIQRVPAGIRSKVQAAVREVDSRSFPGTDYSSETQAIYEVFLTRAKDRVVAYVVYGRGTGEPDYQDTMVIGFDLDGRRVIDEVDSG